MFYRKLRPKLVSKGSFVFNIIMYMCSQGHMCLCMHECLCVCVCGGGGGGVHGCMY